MANTSVTIFACKVLSPSFQQRVGEKEEKGCRVDEIEPISANEGSLEGSTSDIVHCELLVP